MISVKKRTPIELVLYYKEMEKRIPGSGILREVKYQYAEMANGGDGGDLGLPSGETCREHNYPNHPDSFFQEVCALMGRPW